MFLCLSVEGMCLREAEIWVQKGASAPPTLCLKNSWHSLSLVTPVINVGSDIVLIFAVKGRGRNCVRLRYDEALQLL